MTLGFFFKSRCPIPCSSSATTSSDNVDVVLVRDAGREARLNAALWDQNKPKSFIIHESGPKKFNALDFLSTKDRNILQKHFGDEYVQKIELLVLTMMLDEEM